MLGALLLDLGDSFLEGSDIIGVFLMMGIHLSFLFLFSSFFLCLGLLCLIVRLRFVVILNLFLVHTEFFFKLLSSFEFCDNFFERCLCFF